MKGMKASTLVEIMILVGDIGVPCGWNLSLTSAIFYFWATHLATMTRTKQGLCVTVEVDLEESPDKDLELVGVYGFVTDKGSGESVLANNPDLSTDAGMFAFVALIVSVTAFSK